MRFARTSDARHRSAEKLGASHPGPCWLGGLKCHGSERPEDASPGGGIGKQSGGKAWRADQSWRQPQEGSRGGEESSSHPTASGATTASAPGDPLGRCLPPHDQFRAGNHAPVADERIRSGRRKKRATAGREGAQRAAQDENAVTGHGGEQQRSRWATFALPAHKGARRRPKYRAKSVRKVRARHRSCQMTGGGW
jgi:hypothetical protein